MKKRCFSGLIIGLFMVGWVLAAHSDTIKNMTLPVRSSSGVNGIENTQTDFKYGTNLIINGDAENDLNGWTTITGNFDVSEYGASGGFPDMNSPGPENRGNYLFFGGKEISTSAEQIIDISPGASAIDAGRVNCELSAFIGGYAGQEDSTTITAMFMSDSNQMISSMQIGPVSSMDRENITGLLQKKSQALVPAGTRTIIIQIDMQRDAGIINDGYADNISLILNKIFSNENKKVQDSWVYGADSTDRDTNYGDSDRLAGNPTSNCNTANAIAYIKFDLSSYPDTVDKVNLVVEHLPHTSYCYSNCEADFYFYPVIEPWDEMTITYNNRPALSLDPAYGPIHISFPNDLGKQKYDITDIYRQWKSGSLANYGLAIYSPTKGCNNAAVSFSVYSSESTDHLGPALEIITQSPSAAMPLPDTQEIMATLEPGVSPVISIIPEKANPFGLGDVANGGNILSLTAGISALAAPADLYLGLSFGTEIYLFDSNGYLYPFSTHGLVKWRANTTGKINKQILPDINMSRFPGTYTFFLMMTPAESTDFYRLWTVPLIINNDSGGETPPSTETEGGKAGNLTKALLSGLGATDSNKFSDSIKVLVSTIQEGNLDSAIAAITAQSSTAASMITKTANGYNIDWGNGYTFSNGTTVSGSTTISLMSHQSGPSVNDSSRTAVSGVYKLDLNNVNINGTHIPDDTVNVRLAADVIEDGIIDGNLNITGDALSRGGVVFDTRKCSKFPLAGYMKVGDDIVNFDPDCSGNYTAGGSDFPTLNSVTPDQINATNSSLDSVSITLHGKNLWPPYIYDHEGGIDADYNYRCHLRLAGYWRLDSYVTNWTANSITLNFPKSSEKGTYEIYLEAPWANQDKIYYDSANKVTLTVK